MLRELREPFLQQHKGEGAADGSERRTRSTENHHQQRVARLMPGQDFGIDKTVLSGGEVTGEPRQCARQRETREFVREDMKA